jgi:hypothetical protein
VTAAWPVVVTPGREEVLVDRPERAAPGGAVASAADGGNQAEHSRGKFPTQFP